MELFLVVPIVMVLGGMALYVGFAPQTRALPGQASWFVQGSNPNIAAAGSRPQPRNARAEASSLSENDLLLADALGEMIEIKEELTGLRARLDSLDAELHQTPKPRRGPRKSSAAAS